MGKASATGSFKLFMGKIVSTLVLGIGVIIVGLYINNSDYGLYTIALVPAATLLLFQDWGVGTALTKYCANYRASKTEAKLRGIILSGLIFEIAMGAILTLVSLSAANFISISMYNEPASAFLIAFSSITILFTGISAYCTSVMVGFERMGYSTIVLIISATVQGLLSPILVYLGFGAFGAVIGYTAASAASGICGLILLYFSIYKKLPPREVNSLISWQTLKPLLLYGIPLSIGTIVAGGASQIYNFLMARFADLAMIGNFNIAINFSVFISFISFPLQTVLFPAFSKIDSVKDKELLKTVYTSSIKYSSIFLVPVTLALMVLSSSLISTIYGDKWLHAPPFLSLFVAGNLVVLLGSLSYSRLLYAMGETKILLKLNALTFAVGVPLAILLIPSSGIFGVIVVGYLIPPGVSFLVGIHWTWRHYGTKPDFKNSAKILSSAIIAATVTYLFLNAIIAAAWIMLITGFLLFVIIYLIAIPLTGAMNKADINNLRLMFSEIGPLSKILQVPFALIEKLLAIKEKYFNLTK